MPGPIITVDRLAKAYRIGLKDQIPDTLVGAVTGLAKAPVRKFRQLRRLNTFGTSLQGAGSGESGAGGDTPADIVWALRDVSFEVQEGEVLGVIGRNGAGKSTLLKILSRITEPTSGRAVLRGRVSSLLEVGTGFHPELTGRDNVYMNGTILGMTKREIDAKFDEIVDFSGVEKFLDTPIKRYSSGMTVRLAFAVAAHLEPEILIVDEVLAVGDAEFQKKCMGKMQDVARGGRTILFVSHNMDALRRICTKGLVIHAGRLAYVGPVLNAVTEYVSKELDSLQTTPIYDPDSPISSITVTFNDMPPAGGLFWDGVKGDARIKVAITARVPIAQPPFEIACTRRDGLKLFGLTSNLSSVEEPARHSRNWTFIATLATLGLPSQELSFDLGVGRTSLSRYSVLWQNALRVKWVTRPQGAIFTPDSMIVPELSITATQDGEHQ